MPAFTHQPVLLDECLDWLALRPGQVVVDGTLGGGGHSEAILERTAPSGRLIGLDLDPQALEAAGERLNRFGERAVLVHASFRDLARVLAELEIDAVDGVLLDLGVSSPQLDQPERGFRFGPDTAEDVALDMRMDPTRGATAAEHLRRATQDELADWFHHYGDVRGARRLARRIVQTRSQQPIETAADLRRVIREAGIGRGRKHDPATLVFQALRIAVNDELGALREGLEAAIAGLRPGGRVVVLAYHSAEDRIVKRAFRDAAKGCVCPPRQPDSTCDKQPSLTVHTKPPLRPPAAEVERNPRARSACLRAAERIAEAA